MNTNTVLAKLLDLAKDLEHSANYTLHPGHPDFVSKKAAATKIRQIVSEHEYEPKKPD